MMFLSLIATAITLLITTFFLIETRADRQDLRPLTRVPAQIAQKANVGDEVPVDTEDFKITRLKSTNSYIVLIKKSPFNEAKIKAEEWFEEHFPENDICEIKISFIPAKNVNDKLTAKDQAVEGCPEPKRPTPQQLKAK